MSTLAQLQKASASWHARKFPEATALLMMAKATEELGEVARAMVGEIEGREGRGDVGDEAAQVVLVLLSLIGRFYPERNLLSDVFNELSRHLTAEQNALFFKALHKGAS